MANILHVERAANKITLGATGTTINIASHTASKILALDGSKNLEVVTIGTSLDYTRPTLNTVQDIQTTASPEFAGIELGHTDDTTITRVGAGVIAVEGVTVAMVGDAPTAHSIASHNDTTGTGAELNTLTDGSDAGALHSHAAAYQPLDDVLTDLAVLTAVANDEFIVGTGAGVYAHENPATAATSMGLGTGDSPQFTGLTLTGTATVEGASVTVGEASTTTGTIILHDSHSANTITLTIPDISAGSLSFTLPPTDGNNLDVLQTNGSGVLTWVALSGQTQGDVLDDLNALGANPFSGDPHPDFLVGTSAGTLAWHSGATARTSIGLGTGDSPTFSNLTVSNTFSITGLLVTGDTQLGDNVALDTIGINVAPDADVLIKGSFASTGSGDDFCYNNELFTHTEDDSTAHTYIYGTNSSMTVNDDLTVDGTFTAIGHKQFLEAGLTTMTGVGDPVAYLYGYHAVVDWAAAPLGAANYAAIVVGFKANVTGNLGTVGNTIKWGVDISVSESAVTHYGGRFTAQGAIYNYGVWGYATGAHTTNYGLYGYAAGATTNWGLYVAAGNAFFAGNVGIGKSDPEYKVDIVGNIRSIVNIEGWVGWIENQGTGVGVHSGLVVTAGEDSSDSILLLRSQDSTVRMKVTGEGKVNIEGTITLKERASADEDTAAYGQDWVKNTSPCTRWFTDDAGNDGQMMLMRSTTISSDSDAMDVQGCNVLWVDTSSGNVVLGGLANGVDNQLLYVFKYGEVGILTIEHQEGTGTQKFMLNTANLVWDGVGVCLPFICKGGTWYIAAYPRSFVA